MTAQVSGLLIESIVSTPDWSNEPKSSITILIFGVVEALHLFLEKTQFKLKNDKKPIKIAKIQPKILFILLFFAKI